MKSESESDSESESESGHISIYVEKINFKYGIGKFFVFGGHFN